MDEQSIARAITEAIERAKDNGTTVIIQNLVINAPYSIHGNAAVGVGAQDLGNRHPNRKREAIERDGERGGGN